MLCNRGMELVVKGNMMQQQSFALRLYPLTDICLCSVFTPKRKCFGKHEAYLQALLREGTLLVASDNPNVFQCLTQTLDSCAAILCLKRARIRGQKFPDGIRAGQVRQEGGSDIRARHDGYG
jgi:hypothetical protein